ncbi:hypothetical protein ACFFMN_25565 [Planobispora siamensis]|uniref:Uncharacterized protein n=1 Tax=Planobispora siamensis TaxID=936338 RepID=A0A8J3SK93_9ACTN|nr:hypothetical protein [Planobispora siamensis]GIH94131.1 hypothetical protein Psi01_47610 [Planobispora siamensis]
MRPYRQVDELNRAVEELSVRIYKALRDGGLDAGPLVELACLMEERNVSTAVTRELLERPAAELTAADLARLGEALLGEIGFKPGFALEPGLLAPLEEALKIVERDVRATGITGTLRMVLPDWDTMGLARVEFEGICQGNGLGPGGDVQEVLWSVADAAQEVVMEVIWKAWPVCPVHNRGLSAGLEDEIAVWRCTGGGTHTVAPVGELSSEAG